MRKIFFAFLIIALFVLISDSVFASAPPPSPKCNIEGVIQSVEFKDAYDEPCLTEENGCPTDMELNHPARYFFKIRIDTVSYASGETDFETCEKMLSLNTEQTIFINKNEVKEGDFFESGQKIRGQVSSFSGGKSFDSYEIDQFIDDSSAKIGIYVITTIVIIVLLVLLIYFLRRNKK